MTQRPWLPHYADDVAPDLAETSLTHLPAMLRAAAETNAKTTAFTQCMPNGMNGSLTYAQIDSLSDDFASYLREVVGLSQGDRVAVQMPNCLAYPVVAFGVFKAGCVLVNTNPLYTPTEMVHQFSDSGAKALVVIDMFADRLPEVLPKTSIETVVTVRISEFFPPLIAGVIRGVQKVWSRSLPKITVEHTAFQKALAAGRERRDSVALERYIDGIGPDTIAALQYTGGTTGVSKGAMLTHGNLVSNTLQMIQMCGAYMRPGVEVVLTALPLYHIFAFTVNLLAFYHLGSRNILVPSPRPPSNLKRAFENYKITWVTGVNTLFNALLNERWFLDSPPRHLRASAAGGMALFESVAEQWSKVTGTPIVEGYGLTETSPVLSFNPFGPTAKAGTIGIPVPSTELRCIDEKGKEVAPGTPGEIAAKGPQVMLGYWQRPADTAEAIVDGFFRTGDIAEMDADGFFTIVDRKKDMVLVSGFNVYPNEIEERIAELEGVLEVGVVGIPDDKTGEAVRAYIVGAHAHGQTPPTEAEVIAHCRETLAAYKVPKSVRFVDELPKSPIGKILRRELRAEAVTSATASIETQGRELS
jgi:long-chain acyl-CoA synthetase